MIHVLTPNRPSPAVQSPMWTASPRNSSRKAVRSHSACATTQALTSENALSRVKCRRGSNGASRGMNHTKYWSSALVPSYKQKTYLRRAHFVEDDKYRCLYEECHFHPGPFGKDRSGEANEAELGHEAGQGVPYNRLRDIPRSCRCGCSGDRRVRAEERQVDGIEVGGKVMSVVLPG